MSWLISLGVVEWTAIIGAATAVVGILNWRFPRAAKITKSKLTPIPHSPESYLTGRDEDTMAIRRHFKFSQKPLVLHGGPGVGKTVLARSIAQSDYKDRWVMLPLGSDSEVKTALEPYAQQLNIGEEAGLEAYIRNTLSAMANDKKRWLIIFDNADKDEEAGRARKYALDTNGLDILITSQRAKWPETFEQKYLKVLLPEYATELLSKLSGRPKDKLLKTLAKELDYLPLALTLIGTDLANMPSEITIIEYIANFRERLADAPENERYKKSVITAVSLAFERLGESAQTILKIAAFMDPNDIDDGFFQRGVDGIKENNIEPLPQYLNDVFQNSVVTNRALAECESHSLLYSAKWREHDTRRIHRTTQWVLRKLMGDKKVVYVGALARLGRAQLSGNPQYDQENWPAYHRLAPHAEALIPLIDILTKEDGKHTSIWFNRMGVFMTHASGDIKFVIAVSEGEVFLDKKIFGETSVEYSMSLNNLTGAKDKFARTRAEKERILIDAEIEKTFESLILLKGNLPNSDLSLATTLTLLAEFHWARKRYNAAEEYFQECLRLRQEGEAEIHLIAATLGNLGAMYSEWANSEGNQGILNELYQKSLKNLSEASLETRRSLGEIHSITAMRIGNLSAYYNDVKEYKESLIYSVWSYGILMLLVDKDVIQKHHPQVDESRVKLCNILSKLGRDIAEIPILIDAVKPEITSQHEKWLAAKDANEDYYLPPISMPDGSPQAKFMPKTIF